MTDYEEAYAELLQRQQSTGRVCGVCTMCCKVLGIDDPPHLIKPPDTKCVHCASGKGCRIYDRRPSPCRSFFCQWLIDPILGDEWSPARSHMVVYAGLVYAGVEELPAFVIEVDRERPERWLQQPYFNMICRLASGNPGLTVRVGKHHYVIAPAEAAANPQKVTWSNLRLRVRGVVGTQFATAAGDKFVWVEVDVPAEFNRAWRAGRQGAAMTNNEEDRAETKGRDDDD